MDSISLKHESKSLRESLSASIVFWDLLVVLLLVFRVISDLGVSTLILALVAAVLKIGFKQSLERSWTSRAACSLWMKWLSALERRPLRSLIFGTTWVGAIWSLAALRRHQALDSHAFDLGIFTNAIWNLVHGNGFYSSVKGGISLFADHQSPLFWLLAPIFALIPRPETLLVVQAFGLAAGAIPLYFLGKQFMTSSGPESAEQRTRWEVGVLPLLYWAALPVRNATQCDFHPEVLMLPLFLAAALGLQARSTRARVLGVFSMILSLMAKESAGPVAAGMGLAWLLGAGPARTRSFTRRAGLALIILGSAAFLFDLKIVPKLLGGSYAYDDLYAQYGGGLRGVLLAPFLHPVLFFQQLFGPARLKFLAQTLGPLAGAPLFNLPGAVAALPGYLMLFLSAGDHRVDIAWHYGIEPSVGLFFALPGALLLWRGWFDRSSPARRKWMIAWILFAVFGSFGRGEFYKIIHNQPDLHAKWIHSRFLPCVDPGIPLAASEALVPHLSTRRWIHRPDFLWRSPREQAQCVIYDRSVGNWPMDGDSENRLLEMMKSPPWIAVYRCGALSVWTRGPASCLSCQPPCPESGS